MRHQGVCSRLLNPIVLILGTLVLCGCESKPGEKSGGTKPISDGPAGAAKGFFVDVTKEAGITFVHDRYARGDFYFPEINGAGCAFLDYDNDGCLDIFFVQSGCDLADPGGPGKPCELFRNRGDGTFENVTEASGAGVTGFGQGLAVGDYDNDGFVDIYVANVGPNVLLRNNGNGTFTDVTAEAGVGDAGWAIPAAFIDYDADGWLDLYVGNYVIWSVETDVKCRLTDRGIRDYCGPSNYTPQVDVLYHNNGDGTFTDVTEASGLASATGPAMSAICADFNGDAMIDIYVANDQFANQLWVLQKDGTFKDEAHVRGCALNEMGKPESSMGTNAEDLDGDGDLELFMVHFARETSTVYFNTGGFFEDRSTSTGLTPLSVRHSSFGAIFFDPRNRGDSWVYIGNGKANIEGKPSAYGKDEDVYVEQDQLLEWSSAAGRFRDITERAGPVMDVELVSRGVAGGDFDNDGDVDILLSHNNGPARLLRNDAANATGNHWLMVRCLAAGGKRDSIGTQVVMEAAGRKRRRDVIVNYSYACASDSRVHFGLGQATKADKVTITWPGGARSVYSDVSADQVFVVQQSAGETQTSAVAAGAGKND